MSEEGTLPGNGASPHVIPLVILLDTRTNQVNLAQGPLGNYLLCLGMLEMARAIVLKKVHDAMQPKVIRASATDLDGLIDPSKR